MFFFHTSVFLYFCLTSNAYAYLDPGTGSVILSAIVAGIIVTSSSLDGMDPTLQWILAIVAGGGTAGTIQLGTVATRAVSTATTGGIANPLVSTVEAGACIFCTILALLLPILAAIMVVGLMLFSILNIVERMGKKIFTR